MIVRQSTWLARFGSALARPIVNVRPLSGQKSPPSFSSTNRPIKTSCVEKPKITFKISDNSQRTANKVDIAYPAGSNVSLYDLEMDIAGRRILLNLTWLRDSCHCSHCTHTHSRQRLFTAKDFAKEKFEIDELRILEDVSKEFPFAKPSSDRQDGMLLIKWADGHESQYSLSWLTSIHELYKESNLKLPAEKRPTFHLPRDDFYSPIESVRASVECWTVKKFQDESKTINYKDLIDGFEFHDDDPTFINANNISSMSEKRLKALVTLTEQLNRFGLAKIENIPTERNQVLRVARSMAYERPTGYGTIFDVVVEPSEEINLAYSTQEFDLHSDLTYRETSPGVQLLHCIRNSDEGGLSYFSDAFNAAYMLKEEDPILFEALLQFPATFVVRDPYRNIKFRRQKTILTLDHLGELDEVYYSPFMLPPVGFIQDVKLFYLALDRFTQLLQSKENKLITKMVPGDLFIFHNRRVLHGRSSYGTTNSNRFLQGCYMDWDEIGCLYEKLISNKS